MLSSHLSPAGSIPRGRSIHPAAAPFSRHYVDAPCRLLAAVVAPQQHGTPSEPRQQAAATSPVIILTGAGGIQATFGESSPSGMGVDSSATDKLYAVWGEHGRAMEALLEEYPELVHQPMDRLQRQVMSLQHSLDVPLDKVLLMVSRKPEVLDCPPSFILGRCQDMSMMLTMSLADVQGLIAKQPEFLDMSMEALSLRCHRLSGALGVSLPEAATTLTRLPSSSFFELLSMRTSAVHQRMEQLEILLGAEGLPHYRGVAASLEVLPTRRQEDCELAIDDSGLPILANARELNPEDGEDSTVSGKSSSSSGRSAVRNSGRVEWNLKQSGEGLSMGHSQSRVKASASGMDPSTFGGTQLKRQQMRERALWKVKQLLPPSKQQWHEHSAGSQRQHAAQHSNQQGQKPESSLPGAHPIHPSSSDLYPPQHGHSSPPGRFPLHGHGYQNIHPAVGQLLPRPQVNLHSPPGDGVPTRSNSSAKKEHDSSKYSLQIHSVVTHLVLKCPRLLVELPLDSIASSFFELDGILQVSHDRLLSMLSRSPELLLLPPSSLFSTAAYLHKILGLNQGQLASRIIQQPAILKLSHDRIQNHLHRLEEMMALTQNTDGYEDAVRLVRRIVRNQPQVLCLSVDGLLVKFAALGKLICPGGGPEESKVAAVRAVEKQPALLSLSTANTEAKMKFLASFLSINRDDVANMIAKEPTLLTLKSRTVEHKLHALCGLTSLPLGEMKTCAQEYPLLLVAPTANLEYKLYEMSFLLGVPTSAVVMMLIAYPPAVMLSTPTEFKTLLETRAGCSSLGTSLIEVETGGQLPQGRRAKQQFSRIMHRLLHLPRQDMTQVLESLLMRGNQL
eukprot:gene14051-19988_t